MSAAGDPAVGLDPRDDPDRAASAGVDREGVASAGVDREAASSEGVVRDVAVVGGGVAGLVAARDLALRGLDVELIEAADDVGGCLRAQRVAGLVLDAGAESYALRSPAVPELVEELGLTGDVVRPRAGGAWLHLPQGGRPAPPTAVLGIPASVRAPQVRRIVGWPGVLRASLDRLLPAPARGPARGATDPPVSLGALVQRRLGRRVLRRLVAPVVSGVHAADPHALDADAVAPGLLDALAREGSLTRAVASLRAAAPAGSAVASLRGGLHRLPSALAASAVQAGATLRTGVPAIGLAARPGGGWEVRTGGDAVLARTVVLAVGPDEATRLLGPVLPSPQQPDAPAHPDPAAPGTAPTEPDAAPRTAPADAAPPADIAPAADIALVTLVVDAPALDAAPRGTGVLVAQECRDVRAKAMTHVSAKWAWAGQDASAQRPGRHVLRLSYGRAGTPPASRPGDGGGLVETALADAATLTGVPLTTDLLVGSSVVRWPGALPVAGPGHRERLAGLTASAAARGVHLTGAWVAGNGLAAVVAHARRTARAIPGPARRVAGPDDGAV